MVLSEAERRALTCAYHGVTPIDTASLDRLESLGLVAVYRRAAIGAGMFTSVRITADGRHELLHGR